jgi:hypothetical protein
MSARAALRRARHHRLFLPVVLTLVLLAGLRWWWKSAELRRVRGGTLANLQLKDSANIYALIDPEQRKALHVSPQAVQRVLEGVLWRYGDIKPIQTADWTATTTRRDYIVTWGRTDGKPIEEPLDVPHPITRRNHLWSVVSFHKGDAGWRFNFSVFVRSLYRAHFPAQESRRRYRQICEEVGITGAMDEDMRFRPFAPDSLVSQPTN